MKRTVKKKKIAAKRNPLRPKVSDHLHVALKPGDFAGPWAEMKSAKSKVFKRIVPPADGIFTTIPEDSQFKYRIRSERRIERAQWEKMLKLEYFSPTRNDIAPFFGLAKIPNGQPEPWDHKSCGHDVFTNSNCPILASPWACGTNDNIEMKLPSDVCGWGVAINPENTSRIKFALLLHRLHLPVWYGFSSAFEDLHATMAVSPEYTLPQPVNVPFPVKPDKNLKIALSFDWTRDRGVSNASSAIIHKKDPKAASFRGKLIPLPNFFDSGKICAGDDFYEGALQTMGGSPDRYHVMSLMRGFLNLISSAPPNSDLLSENSKEYAKNYLSIPIDSQTMEPPGNTGSNLLAETANLSSTLLETFGPHFNW